LTYAFAKPEAVRSFREAETRDPMCAICYWGEAWAWGSDLNWVMGPDEAPFAYAAIQKAVALAPAHATPIERAFIQAMSARYVGAIGQAVGRIGVTPRRSRQHIGTSPPAACRSAVLLEPRGGTSDRTSGILGVLSA
jgi:hypothetical protein